MCLLPRRQIESLEHEHCLAEAQRLSREVEQEGKACELLQKEEDLHNLSLKADSMRQKAEEVSRISFVNPLPAKLTN